MVVGHFIATKLMTNRTGPGLLLQILLSGKLMDNVWQMQHLTSQVI